MNAVQLTWWMDGWHTHTLRIIHGCDGMMCNKLMHPGDGLIKGKGKFIAYEPRMTNHSPMLESDFCTASWLLEGRRTHTERNMSLVERLLVTKNRCK
jgi:hypothetical protein